MLSGFIANIHLESYTRFVSNAEVVAIYARTQEHARSLADKYGIDRVYGDIDKMLDECDIDVVDICLPNFLHYQACLKAAAKNKHVICEKPLAMNLEQANEMIDALKSRNLKLMYAEELCFAPKYERVREMVEQGAVGKVYMLKQGEKHDGPHSKWFYSKETAGGGVMMDMQGGFGMPGSDSSTSQTVSTETLILYGVSILVIIAALIFALLYKRKPRRK